MVRRRSVMTGRLNLSVLNLKVIAVGSATALSCRRIEGLQVQRDEEAGPGIVEKALDPASACLDSAESC
jgi:hypothetical protein